VDLIVTIPENIQFSCWCQESKSKLNLQQSAIRVMFQLLRHTAQLRYRCQAVNAV